MFGSRISKVPYLCKSLTGSSQFFVGTDFAHGYLHVHSYLNVIIGAVIRLISQMPKVVSTTTMHKRRKKIKLASCPTIFYEP